MTESQAEAPRILHYVVSWVLACQHEIVCHCQHRKGQEVYCWHCGTSSVVVKERIRVYRSRAEAARAGPT